MGAAPPTGNIYESADGDPQRQYGPGNRLLQKGNTKYEWDADGRLAEKRETTDEGERVWLYAWNGAGLLQSVDTPDGKRVEFAYDPFARRMEKRVARVGDGDVQAENSTRFVWDGDVLAHEVRTRAAESGDEIVEERAYVFEDGAFDPAAQRDGQKWLHYSNEINGAPNRLVNSRGESECEVERDAWGATHLDGKATTPFGFAGQYRDEETGLSYNRARYYDSEAGRFASADPLGIIADFNDARYGQNPLRSVDPLGLESDGCGDTEPPKPLRPEAGYLGSKKHGIHWKEGLATAKSLKTDQGQWGSEADLAWAGQKAATLKPRQGAFFDLPEGHSSVVHRKDGTTVPAHRVWVRNNGTGTFHGHPRE